ncbi:MAG: hypothetical protein DMF60_05230 [Acidobacteria bacterium]|nr:MAG: hypothetical protein DMF60_05230 [Acidobacteriota bacterium]
MSGLLALGALGLASSRAEEAKLFSLSQAKDRTGYGSFPHDQKEHSKVQCADCHLAAREKPKNTDQPMAKDFPHSSCVRCHNFAAEFFKGAFGQPSRFCGVCHETRRISKGDKALRPGVFPRPTISDFEDEFSHKAHRKVLPADFRIVPFSNPPYGSQFKPGESARCTDCHEQVRKPATDAKDMKTEEGHATCFVCHDGAASEPRRVSPETFPYASDCKVCHELRLSDRSPRAHSLFGSIKGFRHDDHDIDIRPKKRSDFPLPAAPDRLCSECHKPVDQVEKLSDIRLPGAGYCDKCHINNKPGLPGKLADDILNKLRRD